MLTVVAQSTLLLASVRVLTVGAQSTLLFASVRVLMVGAQSTPLLPGVSVHPSIVQDYLRRRSKSMSAHTVVLRAHSLL